MSLENSDCIRSERFGSVGEFLSEMSRRHSASEVWEIGLQSIKGSNSFTQTESLEVAHELITQGWAFGAAELNKISDTLCAGLSMTASRAPELELVGGCVDIGSYLTGDPECMINPLSEAPAPCVRVIMSVSASASTDVKQIRNQGAAVYTIARLLETQETRVEIVAHFGARQAGKWQDVQITLKRPEDRFDAHVLAYCMTHPSFLRRHMFMWLETMGGKGWTGYGNVVGYSDTEDGQADIDFDWIVPPSEYASHDYKEAFENAKISAREAGVILQN